MENCSNIEWAVDLKRGVSLSQYITAIENPFFLGLIGPLVPGTNLGRDFLCSPEHLRETLKAIIATNLCVLQLNSVRVRARTGSMARPLVSQILLHEYVGGEMNLEERKVVRAHLLSPTCYLHSGAQAKQFDSAFE